MRSITRDRGIQNQREKEILAREYFSNSRPTFGNVSGAERREKIDNAFSSKDLPAISEQHVSKTT